MEKKYGNDQIIKFREWEGGGENVGRNEGEEKEKQRA